MTTLDTAPEIPDAADPARLDPAQPELNPLAVAAVRGAFSGAARVGFTWLIELIQEHIIH